MGRVTTFLRESRTKAWSGSEQSCGEELDENHIRTGSPLRPAQQTLVQSAANVLCGWLLHSKTFLSWFVHLSEVVMCPACLRGFDRWP